MRQQLPGALQTDVKKHATAVPPLQPACFSASHCTQRAPSPPFAEEELTHFRWSFRFKHQAGEFWLLLDPSWTGEGAHLQRLFHPDGTTVPGDPRDPFWGMLLAAAGGGRAAQPGPAVVAATCT